MGGGTWKQLTSEDNCPGPCASTFRLGPLVERPARIASMGPPPFGDGNYDPVDFSGLPYVLQWGHRPSAMETCPVSMEWANVPTPSMGPPPFGMLEVPVQPS